MVFIIGFLLSPLTPWNDLFLNIPIAVFLAYLTSFFLNYELHTLTLFWYFLTNVVGLIMVHKGTISSIQSKAFEKVKKNNVSIIIDIILTTIYSLIIYKFGNIDEIQFEKFLNIFK